MFEFVRGRKEEKKKMKDYEKEAQKFLKENGIEFRFMSLGQQKPDWDAKEWHDCYTLALTRDGSKAIVIPYWYQSIAGAGQEPTPYDLLAGIQKYPVDNEFGFYQEYGYEPSKESREIFKAVKKEWQDVEKFFTNLELDELREIN